jgi:hypothetical protein
MPDGAQPGRIDATCGAAGSCTRSGTGCAQAPRRPPRGVHSTSSAARRPPPVFRCLTHVRCNRPLSVATAAWRPLGIRSSSAVSGTCIDHVSSARCVVLEDSVPSLRNPVKSVPVRAVNCSHRRVGTAGATSAPAAFATAAGGPLSVENCRCRLRQTRVSSSALRAAAVPSHHTLQHLH